MARVPHPNLLGALVLVTAVWLARSPLFLLVPMAAGVLLCTGARLHFRGRDPGVPTFGRWLVATAVVWMLSVAALVV